MLLAYSAQCCFGSFSFHVGQPWNGMCLPPTNMGQGLYSFTPATGLPRKRKALGQGRHNLLLSFTKNLRRSENARRRRPIAEN